MRYYLASATLAFAALFVSLGVTLPEAKTQVDQHPAIAWHVCPGQPNTYCVSNS